MDTPWLVLTALLLSTVYIAGSVVSAAVLRRYCPSEDDDYGFYIMHWPYLAVAVVIYQLVQTLLRASVWLTERLPSPPEAKQ